MISFALVALLSAAPPPPGPAPAAPACSLVPGGHTITVDGGLRSYLVQMPSVPTNNPTVVFVWHGWGASSRSILQSFAGAADDAIMIAPSGLPRTFPGLQNRRDGWQIKSDEFGDRDLKLFDALYDHLAQSHCTDMSRVFSVGFSNGAFFSNLLACKRGDKLAGIVPIAGGGPDEASCHQAVPTLWVHGRADNVVPYARGKKTAEFWAKSVGCRAQLPPTENLCMNPRGCASFLEMCVHPGKHTFPRALRGRVKSFLANVGRSPP